MTGLRIAGRAAAVVIISATALGMAGPDGTSHRRAAAQNSAPVPVPTIRPVLKSATAPLPHTRPVIGDAQDGAAGGAQDHVQGVAMAGAVTSVPALMRPLARGAKAIPEAAGEAAEDAAGAAAQTATDDGADADARITLAAAHPAAGSPADVGADVSTEAEGAEAAADPVDMPQAEARLAPDAPLPPPRPEGEAVRTAALTVEGAPLPAPRPAPPPPSNLISKAQYDLLKQAFAALDKRDFTAALALKDRLTDEPARDLIEWRYVTSAPLGIGYRRMAAFAAKHPLWPDHGKLAQRMEEALFSENHEPDAILDIFADAPPVSGAGKATLAWALLNSGDEAAAQALISEVWRNERLTAYQEAKVRKRFDALLTKEDHKVRFDRLLYRGALTAAKSMLKYVPAGSDKLIEMRAAIENKRSNAGTLLSRLPAALRNEPIGMFSRIQWLRRDGKAEAAAELMLKAPRSASRLHPGEWWTERHILTRAMLQRERYEDAYKIASGHGQTEGAQFAEAEFLSGWIALRHLNKPKLAREHFTTLADGVQRPISLSRAHYWLGRTHEVEGDEDKAREHYADAAAHSEYFYGQLAHRKLGGEALHYPPMPAPDDAMRARFTSQDLVRAALLLNDLNETTLARSFLTEVARQRDDAQELLMTAELANWLGMPDIGFRVGRMATVKGVPLVEFAYLTTGLPQFERRGKPVEDALIHALVRQESAFNPQAISHAGAQGLMQLMTPTAKAVAKQHGAPFSQARLLTDPAYNAMLGTAHMGDLIANWNGSYIMAVAAYNAGESRLRQWIERYGDPRDPAVDTVDWIESIPFSETRNYVMRVLESLQVYRARLNNNMHALRIEADLTRGQLAD